MLSAIELADMRADVLGSLDQRCTVYRPQGTRTEVGGTAVTYVETGTYACRLAPARSPEQHVAASRLSGSRAWWVTLPHDAGVRTGDRLTVGGLTLHVVGTQAGESYLVALRALCEEAS